MSVIAVRASNDRAFVAVDTLRNSTDGRLDHISKILVLPHIGAVVAYRGYVLVGSTLFSGVLLNGSSGDDLAAAFPSIVERSIAKAQAAVAGLQVAIPDIDACDAVMVYPSPAKGRISTIYVVHHAGQPAAEVIEDFAELDSPRCSDNELQTGGTGDLEAGDLAEVVGRLIEAACLQAGAVKAGGLACVAEISTERIIVTRHQIGALETGAASISKGE